MDGLKSVKDQPVVLHSETSSFNSFTPSARFSTDYRLNNADLPGCDEQSLQKTKFRLLSGYPFSSGRIEWRETDLCSNLGHKTSVAEIHHHSVQVSSSCTRMHWYASWQSKL